MNRGRRFPRWSRLLLLAWLAAAARPGLAAGLLWTATGPAGSAVLFGSIHFGVPQMYPLPAAVQQAFAQCDALIVEVDLEALDPLQAASAVASVGMYPADTGLREHLDPMVWDALAAAAGRYGVSPRLLERQKPWLAALTLTTLELSRSGFREDLGIDRHFMRAARARGIPVVELESLPAQLGLFDALAPAEQVRFLRVTLADLSEGETLFRDTVAAWLSGDPSQINDIINRGLRDDGGEALYQTLLVARNGAMAARLDELMAAGGRYFVVVGAGHLVGQDSIVERLRERGYTLSR